MKNVSEKTEDSRERSREFTNGREKPVIWGFLRWSTTREIYKERNKESLYIYIQKTLTNISVFTIKEKKICSNIFKLYYFIKFNI